MALGFKISHETIRLPNEKPSGFDDRIESDELMKFLKEHEEEYQEEIRLLEALQEDRPMQH